MSSVIAHHPVLTVNYSRHENTQESFLNRRSKGAPGPRTAPGLGCSAPGSSASRILSELVPAGKPAVEDALTRPAGLEFGTLTAGRFAQRLFASRADRAVELRHHLGRHQLHRAPREPRVHPVHAGVDDLAELARALAEREQLVDDPVHGAADDEAAEQALDRHRAVVLGLVHLEDDVALGAHHLLAQLPPVEA